MPLGAVTVTFITHGSGYRNCFFQEPKEEPEPPKPAFLEPKPGLCLSLKTALKY